MFLQFVPETYVPALETRKARKQRKSTGDSRWHSALEKSDKGLVNTIVISCHKPFRKELLYLRLRTMS